MLNYSLYTDHELMSLLKGDDHAAFTEIYKRYWKKMLLISWNHNNDNAASKDIVHEVFISLWERRHLVEVLNLAAFLATSVKFSIYKYYQRQNRRTELAQLNYEFNELTNEEDKLDALFLQEYINGVVEEMPEKCRLVFRYSREMGMKNNEIALKIRVTEKAVEANLTRALKIIRAELKNYGWAILITLHSIYTLLK
ncbi:MAG: sigma-70 family polymerase sigma factor [Mucilaginibacter sp.]|nr:sigma-70 family polymerase sigma factor [Mucilaginibacter sp.]